MMCAKLDAYLDDWVDGTLGEIESREIRAHLADCPGCRERERRLRQLVAHAAALPRLVAPSRDLWPGIERRIERERAWSWAWLGSHGPALAVAAAVVLALLAVLLHQRPPASVHTVVIPERTPANDFAIRPATVGIDPGLAAVELDYQEASNALLAVLQQRKNDLSPETLASVERNLAVIDEALAEVHRALEKDPASPKLGRMLVSTHRKKVEVLRQLVKLSTAL